MSGLRVLVCGGRDYHDHVTVYHTLDAIEDDGDVRITHVIEGGARGADALAASWASMDRTVVHLQFPADWSKDGKAAGPIRNQRMLEEGKPDLVLAFPGGRGTADMVARARKAGVEVREISP